MRGTFMELSWTFGRVPRRTWNFRGPLDKFLAGRGTFVGLWTSPTQSMELSWESEQVPRRKHGTFKGL